ncbi:MAG: hypothetical protein CMO80_16330 [Verrucomicrobiales bacterium]|nr:hypothetical protein [Verrucomicrobiales bacterium]|tara:strand:- start:54 stop:791 length:738 start_codon:yes stop_codon:yes gene_type:complete
MLVSHRKKFIYTKTMKTASTSVEIFFERYCLPEGAWKETGRRPETVTAAGIVGVRGRYPKGIFYNHMPACEIRDLLEPKIWEEYFKFTCIRNPFDKMISGFTMWSKGKRKRERTIAGKIIAGFRRLRGRANPVDLATGNTEIERFRSWVIQGGHVDDRDKYMIAGQECVDEFIRFERLEEDLARVCAKLDIPFDVSSVPRYKTHQRKHQIPIREYYDAETEKRVRELYAWEFERFKYEMPGAGAY